MKNKFQIQSTKHKATSLCLGIAALSLLPLSAATTILYEQDFSEGGATRDGWFTSRPSENLTISGDALVATTYNSTLDNKATAQILIYFADSPLTIPVGQTLSVSYTYSFTKEFGTEPYMRNGLFNSGTSKAGTKRISADGLNTTVDAFEGYTGYRFQDGNLKGTSSVFINKRNGNSISKVLTTSNSYDAYSANFDEVSRPKYELNTEYSALIEVTNYGDYTHFEVTGYDSNGSERFYSHLVTIQHPACTGNPAKAL